VSRVESGEGVIIFTDMFGGTPSNLSISVMEAGRVEIHCRNEFTDVD
jgi:PTS system mannose-specific IIA component